MPRRPHTTSHFLGGVVARITVSASLIAAAGLALMSSTSPPHGILVGYGSSGFHATAAPGSAILGSRVPPLRRRSARSPCRATSRGSTPAGPARSC